MDIDKELENIQKEFDQKITAISNEKNLEEVRIAFLGRKGSVALLMKQMQDMSLEDKRHYGPLFNTLKTYITQACDQKKEQLLQRASEDTTKKSRYFDVTAYRRQEVKGSLHIYTEITQLLENIFISMGYDIVDGPEVETDYYNFETLNIPKDHPARDMFDTFWISDMPNLLLRTHTSTVQARVMEKHQFPIAIFAPGRVYRHEATDASHDFMFQQGECLLVDKNVSMANLIATAQEFLRQIFEKKDLKIRIRPGYFPFVEPGIEIDAACPFCKNGCSVCKKTQWIELLGAGLVHPNVLQSSNIDTSTYSGFAFGFGISRIAMIKYGINDIRLFHSNAIEFLEQF